MNDFQIPKHIQILKKNIGSPQNILSHSTIGYDQKTAQTKIYKVEINGRRRRWFQRSHTMSFSLSLRALRNPYAISKDKKQPPANHSLWDYLACL